MDYMTLKEISGKRGVPPAGSIITALQAASRAL